MRLHFHATPGDLRVMLKSVEERLPITYVRYYEGPITELGDGPLRYDHAKDITDLGIGKGINRQTSESFVILPMGSSLSPDYRTLNSGIRKVIYSCSGHADSVAFDPGGDLVAERINLSGEASNAMPTKEADRISRALAAAVKRLGWFKTGRRFWISPEAVQRFREGWILTSNKDGHPGLAVTAEELRDVL